MKTLDKILVKQNLYFSTYLLKMYDTGGEDADAPAPIVEDAPNIEEEDDDDASFFSSLIPDGDDEGEDEVPSEIPAVEDGDEESPEVIEESEPEVKEESEEEAPVVEDTPITEQPEGSVTDEVEEAPALSKEAFEEQLNKYKGELEKHYAISDKDAEDILTDPQVVLPRLMANMHLAVLQQVGELMKNDMPKLIGQTVQQNTTRDTRMTEFASRYPELAKKENEKVAATALKTVFQLHPKISFKEALDKVGPVAEALLGKSIQSVVKTPAAKPKPKPHIPTKGRSTAVTKEKPKGDAMSSFIDSILDE